jgi:hypothetical protein
MRDKKGCVIDTSTLSTFYANYLITLGAIWAKKSVS